MERENNIFTLGILSFVFAFFINIVAIILGIIGLSKAKALKAENGGILEGKANTGRILSLLGLILGIVFTAIGIIAVVAFILLIVETNYHF